MAWTRILTAVLAGAAVATLAAPSAGAATTPTVRALEVRATAVPPIGLAQFDTSGHYPQVSATGVDLSAVNRALRNEVLHDQALVREGYRPNQFPSQYRGTYRLGFTTSMMSASTVVVSTLYPSLVLYPGGNDGSGWLDRTVAVPSGKVVPLVGLLTSRSLGLKAIAKYVEAHVVATNACVRLAVDDPNVGPIAKAGFAPTTANYLAFGLARKGLQIGLEQGQVGPEACGAIRVTVPWKVVQPQLNATGLRFLHGLR
jgi:hypothetical protein